MKRTPYDVLASSEEPLTDWELVRACFGLHPVLDARKHTQQRRAEIVASITCDDRIVPAGQNSLGQFVWKVKKGLEARVLRSALLEEEQRTLPSGVIFTRHRCKVCMCYWDTDHPHRRDEPECHKENCPVKLPSEVVK